MTQVHPLFQQIMNSWTANPTCDNCGANDPECPVCDGSGIEPEPTLETLPAYVREQIENESKLRVQEACKLYTIYTGEAATKRAIERGFSEPERFAGRTLANYRKAVKDVVAGIKGTAAHGRISYTPAEIAAIVAGEDIIYAAHAEGKPLPWPWSLAEQQLDTVRKPMSIADASLEHKLAASIALVNRRKQVA